MESATQNPVWATKHVFSDIEHDEVLNSRLDVTVWNFSHALRHECIGMYVKTVIFFQKKGRNFDEIIAEQYSI